MRTSGQTSVPLSAVTERLNYSFSPQHPDLRVDVFLPDSPAPAPPLIVYVHGGGWRLGDRKLCPDLKGFAARSGFAMASIDYRLSGEAIFPAQIEDLKTAIRWLRSNYESFGYDPSRFALWGSSAGGHLAALAATSGPGVFEPADVDVSSAVSAVVDGYGPTDILQMDRQRETECAPLDDPESLELPPGARSADESSFESLLFGRSIAAVPTLVQQANPIAYVKPGLPPFLILHGLSDRAVPHSQSVLLYEALAAAGGEAQLALIPGIGHGFFNRPHIDDAGPRTLTMHGTSPEFQTGSHSNTILGLVETFFRRVLQPNPARS